MPSGDLQEFKVPDFKLQLCQLCLCLCLALGALVSSLVKWATPSSQKIKGKDKSTAPYPEAWCIAGLETRSPLLCIGGTGLGTTLNGSALFLHPDNHGKGLSIYFFLTLKIFLGLPWWLSSEILANTRHHVQSPNPGRSTVEQLSSPFTEPVLQGQEAQATQPAVCCNHREPKRLEPISTREAATTKAAFCGS